LNSFNKQKPVTCFATLGRTAQRRDPLTAFTAVSENWCEVSFNIRVSSQITLGDTHLRPTVTKLGYSFDGDEPISVESEGPRLSNNDDQAPEMDLREEGAATDAEVVATDNVVTASQMHTGLDAEPRLSLARVYSLANSSRTILPGRACRSAECRGMRLTVRSIRSCKWGSKRPCESWAQRTITSYRGLLITVQPSRLS
jgi:hypothetical protein